MTNENVGMKPAGNKADAVKVLTNPPTVACPSGTVYSGDSGDAVPITIWLKASQQEGVAACKVWIQCRTTSIPLVPDEWPAVTEADRAQLETGSTELWKKTNVPVKVAMPAMPGDPNPPPLETSHDIHATVQWTDASDDSDTQVYTYGSYFSTKFDGAKPCNPCENVPPEM